MAVIADHRPMLALEVGLVLDGEVDDCLALGDDPHPERVSARAERDVVVALPWAHSVASGSRAFHFRTQALMSSTPGITVTTLSMRCESMRSRSSGRG